MNVDTLRGIAPCYVYDGDEISSACRRLKSALPDYDILYSVKANSFPPLVRHIVGMGIGTDAASAGEVNLVIESGAAPESIFYSAPGKTVKDVDDTLGRCHIITDSLHELELIDGEAARLGANADVGLRISPDFAFDGGTPSPSKFGVCAEDIPELMGRISSLTHIRLCGIHVHILSGVTDTSALAAHYGRIYSLAERMSRYFSVEFINFGSGIGVPADGEFDLDRLGESMKKIADENRRGLYARLIIESGRYIVCRAGRFYSPIVDIKVSRGEKYVIVSSMMGGFLRPVIADMISGINPDSPSVEPLYTRPSPCRISNYGKSIKYETVSIAGPLCTSRDMIRGVYITKPEIGDIIEFTDAGAYGYELSPHGFSSIHPPKRFMKFGDKITGEE